MTTKVDAVKARTIAKRNITVYINKLTPLLAAREGEARKCRSDVEETWEKLMRESDIFTKAHNKIVEATLATVTPGEESDNDAAAAFDSAMDTLEKYQEETAVKMEDIKQKHREFRAYLSAREKQREYAAAAAKYVSERKGILELYRKVENGLNKEAVINVSVKDMSDELEKIFVSMTSILSELKDFAYEAGEDGKAEQEDLVMEHGTLKA